MNAMLGGRRVSDQSGDSKAINKEIQIDALGYPFVFVWVGVQTEAGVCSVIWVVRCV
jgi:hypothetical protein